MTLEEKLRAYAAKGELVHLSLYSSGSGFRATFAAASPAAGYASGEASDPVEAIEKAFTASPAKRAKVTTKKSAPAGANNSNGEKAGGLPTDWTAP